MTTDYNPKILTFHSICDYIALLKAFITNTLNFHQYFEDKLIISLTNHLICTTPDAEQIVILILHF